MTDQGEDGGMTVDDGPRWSQGAIAKPIGRRSQVELRAQRDDELSVMDRTDGDNELGLDRTSDDEGVEDSKLGGTKIHLSKKGPTAEKARGWEALHPSSSRSGFPPHLSTPIFPQTQISQQAHTPGQPGLQA